MPFDTLILSDLVLQYWAEYDDMFITQIADTAQDDHRFWGILLNYELRPRSLALIRCVTTQLHRDTPN
jgi:hypothetical protein